MTPAEAAALLGLPENATEAQITEAYAAHIATVPESDIAAVDALARARDALLAGVRWLPPQSAGAPQGWGMPQGATTPIGLAPQPGGGVPPTPNVAQPGYPPQQPGFPSPPAPAPQYTAPQQPASAPQQPAYPYPASLAPGLAPNPQQPPYPGYPQPSAYPTRRRTPLSNGAIIGIALGSTAVLLVVLLVAVIALAGSAQRGLASAASQHGSAAAPSTAPSSGDPSAADQSYVIDGVTIQPEQGWTFLLTSQRDCPAAEVIVGFADTIDGDSMDQHTETVSLKAGVPYTYTVPDTASTRQYAGIDDLQCVPT
ncbi:hypothetical protein ABCS02_26265 [Microbacterium sp. X-17]|uniref:hypothetical protein n=1 Tax=Microbacterium sp. X-17 TaxID=3144404 RepID=UPI0031F49722